MLENALPDLGRCLAPSRVQLPSLPSRELAACEGGCHLLTLRDWNEPPATNISLPSARRSRRCALVAAHFEAAVPPKPGEMQPNSRCDQIFAPTLPSHSRSVGGDQLAANLALTRSPVATNARSGSAPKPRLPSSARSPLRRCLAPVVAMRRRACGHRSPHSDRAGACRTLGRAPGR